MPSPSRPALFVGLAVTTIMFIGGAWLASRITPPDSTSATKLTAQFKPLEVTVSGVRDRGGKIILLVFDSQAAFDAYDDRRAVGYTEIVAAPGSVSFAFEGLLDGPYAVVAFHDENGNRDLDMADGYPTEGYGVSGTDDDFGEPSFEEAAVAAGNVSFSLYYFPD